MNDLREKVARALAASKPGESMADAAISTVLEADPPASAIEAGAKAIRDDGHTGDSYRLARCVWAAQRKAMLQAFTEGK